MKSPAAEIVVMTVVLAAACADGQDLWALLAKACQTTAAAVGRVGLYAEARATVLTAERS